MRILYLHGRLSRSRFDLVLVFVLVLVLVPALAPVVVVVVVVVLVWLLGRFSRVEIVVGRGVTGDDDGTKSLFGSNATHRKSTQSRKGRGVAFKKSKAEASKLLAKELLPSKSKVIASIWKLKSLQCQLPSGNSVATPLQEAGTDSAAKILWPIGSKCVGAACSTKCRLFVRRKPFNNSSGLVHNSSEIVVVAAGGGTHSLNPFVGNLLSSRDPAKNSTIDSITGRQRFALLDFLLAPRRKGLTSDVWIGGGTLRRTFAYHNTQDHHRRPNRLAVIRNKVRRNRGHKLHKFTGSNWNLR